MGIRSDTLFFLAVNAHTAAGGGPGVYNHDDAQNLLSLIKQNSQKDFCVKFGPLRAKSGAACKTTLNAALAVGVCTGFEDFAKSHCENNAISQLKTVKADILQNLVEGVRTIIAGILNDQKERTGVCNKVAALVPNLINKCVYLVGSAMPASPKK